MSISGRLTARDLRQLETSVPLETLKTVIDLAVEIGREGREGKPIGTMFVVGDTRKVLQHCQPAGFDPVNGYNRPERDLHDPRVREAVKEIAVPRRGFRHQRRTASSKKQPSSSMPRMPT